MSATLGYVADWQVTQWIKTLQDDGKTPKSWVGLFQSDPGPGQVNAADVEVAGTSYARASLFWKAANTPRALISSKKVEWRGLPETAVTHLGIWNDDTGGQLRAIIPLVDPVYVVSDGYFSLAAGDIYLRWP